MQTPAQGVVMAPVSPAVAKLLHQLQAQIINEAQDRPVSPGAIILQPRGKLTSQNHYERGKGYRQVCCIADNGDSVILQTPFFVSAEDAPYFRPGTWYGSERRCDEDGRSWSAALPCDYVMDDFGELVPVGGAQ